MSKVSKQIKLTYEGKDYVLEYNRASVREMENRGFVASEMASKPATMLPIAFEGAFIKNHRFVKYGTIDKIFSHIKNKQDLISQLSTMIVDCYNSLMNDEVEADDEGNALWEIVG